MDDFFKAPSLTFDTKLSMSAQRGEHSLDSQFSLAPHFSTQAQELFTSNPVRSENTELISLDLTPLSFSKVLPICGSDAVNGKNESVSFNKQFDLSIDKDG